MATGKIDEENFDAMMVVEDTGTISHQFSHSVSVAAVDPLKELNSLIVERELKQKQLELYCGPKLPTKEEAIHTPCQKSHWDYVLKEATWLANDFMQERQRHVSNGKKLSKAIEMHHATKDQRRLRKEKEEAIQLRRTASKLSKEVRKFWMKIDKVIAYKQKGEADEARQKAMDKHLIHLVKQTERYTHLLAENMRGGGLKGMDFKEIRQKSQKSNQTDANSRDNSNINDRKDKDSKKKRVVFAAEASDSNSEIGDDNNSESLSEDEATQSTHDDDGGESEANSDHSDGDPDPDLEEYGGHSSSRKSGRTKEVGTAQVTQVLLSCGGDVPPRPQHNQNHVARVSEEDYESRDDNDDDDGDDEYVDEEDDAPDDETTLLEEEALAAGEGGGEDEELGHLQRESEIPIEQLRAMYAARDDSDSGGEEMQEDEDEEGVGFEKEGDADIVMIKSGGNDSEAGNDGEDNDDDDEFEEEEEGDAPDDETTLLEEEALAEGDSVDVNEELDGLQRESEIPIEQLRAMYASSGKDSEYSSDEEESGKEGGVDEEVEENLSSIRGDTNRASDLLTADSDDNDDDDGDDEYDDEEDDAPDDETTLLEEEALAAGEGGGEDEELGHLQRESEIPIEQLRAMYAARDDSDSGGEEMQEDEDEEGEEGVITKSSDHKQKENTEESQVSKKRRRESSDSSDGDLRRSSRRPNRAKRYGIDENDEDDDNRSQSSSEDAMSVVSDVEDDGEDKEAESADDALRRLEQVDNEARSIKVDRPFVLAKKLMLREYQHIGLNWLVSLHERRLNGILADEMGLGKTIQTIAMLAYLAAYRGLWGPHLVVVPTSCIINWESEFKRWCPIFKILTYYGSSKHRKNLRKGWSKLNSFHVCITSYQLVVQDAMMFRRKRWYYMILDEAHNIKNFKSQRWQTLLNFNTQRRLLLTGTPLQNNLMELWSLMHFLMPHIFRSRKEFSYWFSNPLSNMVEGNRGVNNDLISRLHGIMRPFLLRRLKKDVAKQLPPKFEHVVMCKLSKRQLFLYEEFMARSSTSSLLSEGNYMGMMNILMQLRKVCNHPDLFEERPIVSPFVMSPLVIIGPTNILRISESTLQQISSHLLSFWDFDWDALAREEVYRSQEMNPSFVTIEDISVEAPALQSSSVEINQFMKILKQKLYEIKLHRQLYNHKLSQYRCNMPRIPYDWRLVRAATFEPLFVDRVLQSRKNSKLGYNITSSWYDLIESATDRFTNLLEIIHRFVFVLPRITSFVPTWALHIKLPSQTKSNLLGPAHELHTQALQQIKDVIHPFYPAYIRQRIFFPDRKLVQYDSGKLQILSELLRTLKKGGHKCLIFTQMSKMLDILEIFLNLNGHTYVRLDGSTNVEKRQKLMDRFNSDPKLFVFILSTRSGGLGINLTGADTVIFYDSDWNPAMDAQAQDRAHRIGQTREVHIYRLVCSSTVEENILVKAKQKKHLDFLVMTEGNFSEGTLFTSTGLKDMLSTGLGSSLISSDSNTQSNPLASSSEAKPVDIEAAMAAVEDDEDVKAMKGARAEAEHELDEFDENAPVKVNDDDEDDGEGKDVDSSAEAVVPVIDTGNEEKDMEIEFAKWQATVGPDFRALEAALKPIERFGLRVHTEIEPFYSMFFMNEQQRLKELQENEEETEWNIEEIEEQKEEEEYRALAEGELLATEMSDENVNELQEWYLNEKKQRERRRRRRMLTGEGWSIVVDDLSQIPFWYNNDTGDASYATPSIVIARDNYKSALERGYNGVPLKLMIHILEFLHPYPDRMNAAPTCARWREAAFDESFLKRVLPVETGLKTAATKDIHFKLEPNTFISVEDAIKSSLPGDIITLGAGHHWESSLIIEKPLRLIGESDDPGRCVLELTGGIQIVNTPFLNIIGITIRRPKKVPHARSLIAVTNSRISLSLCSLNNEGAGGSVISLVNESLLVLYGSSVRGGSDAGVSMIDSRMIGAYSMISDNVGYGLLGLEAVVNIQDCHLLRNTKDVLSFLGRSAIGITYSEIRGVLNDLSIESADVDTPLYLVKGCTGDEVLIRLLKGLTTTSSQSFSENELGVVSAVKDASSPPKKGTINSTERSRETTSSSSKVKQQGDHNDNDNYHNYEEDHLKNQLLRNSIFGNGNNIINLIQNEENNSLKYSAVNMDFDLFGSTYDNFTPFINNDDPYFDVKANIEERNHGINGSNMNGLGGPIGVNNFPANANIGEEPDWKRPKPL